MAHLSVGRNHQSSGLLFVPFPKERKSYKYASVPSCLCVFSHLESAIFCPCGGSSWVDFLGRR